jgi:Carboxypeptidase regulatory-like domain
MAGHLTLKLKPPRSLAGRVIDSHGKPIPDVFVNVDTWRGFRSLGVFLKTDAEGRFLWLDSPPETFLINASRTGFASIVQRRVSAEEQAITLILKRSLAISGLVTDAATGKSIERANVEIGVADPKTGEMVWSQERRVFSFQGRLQGDIDVENRPELRLRVRAPGYDPAVSRVFRREENQVEYDVKLRKPDQ